MAQFVILNQSSIRIQNRLFGRITRLIRGAGCILLMLLIGACTLPAYKIIEDAGQAYQVKSSENFKHLWISNVHDAVFQHKLGPVIVFIDGDGAPWQRYNRVAFDPTPDEPLLLQWFLTAEVPAIYLGRPCYFDLNDKACSAYWFTHGRYSEPVVSSLVSVLSENIANRDIILVGHSGGATLAMLMAAKLSQVKAVVTIAGNLNVQAWTKHHQYTDLLGSLDPSLRQTATQTIKQVHFYSPLDAVIKTEWVKIFSTSQLNSIVVALPVKGHNQAWVGYQAEIMRRVLEISADLVEKK